jgi:hypothetical protein
MLKTIYLLLSVCALGLCHTTYPSHHSIYGSQQGLFVPSIQEIRNVKDSSDVIYNRFCKAICFLYVPHKKTCGLNNQIYINDCQAKCDRIGTDINRLKFNEKCCCSGGSHMVDASYAKSELDGVHTLASAATCVYVKGKSSAGVVSSNAYINVFAVPNCIANCLGIDSVSDLEFTDNTRTYTLGCADNINV